MNPGAAEGAVQPNSSASPPAGWYPEEGFRLRWWDGSRWTERRAIPAPTRVDPRKRTAFAFVAGTLAGLLLIGSIVGYAYFSGKAHDVRSLDDSVIIATATQACTSVTERIEGATGSRSHRIEIGNGAISQLVADMNAIGADKLKADKPALDWITDWQLLAGARAVYAELTITTSGAQAPFIVPTSDGYPITKRMIDVSPQECARAVDFAAHP